VPEEEVRNRRQDWFHTHRRAQAIRAILLASAFEANSTVRRFIRLYLVRRSARFILA
jgi:hypothetical protein